MLERSSSIMGGKVTLEKQTKHTCCDQAPSVTSEEQEACAPLLGEATGDVTGKDILWTK